MTRVAVLVIAALNQPVYRHYIASYWTELIRHTNLHSPNIDVYLLIENGTDPAPFAHVAEHVIEDPVADFDPLVEARFRRPGVPSILSKTVHAFDVLDGRYDLFFRTNLSSMLMVPGFEALVEARPDLGYAGTWVWTDALRADLERHNWVGADKSIRHMYELDEYPGNTFLSGAGFFLGAEQARAVVAQRDRLRYDIADDVAIGLMFAEHEQLPGVSVIVHNELSVEAMMDRIRSTSAAHVRLQHLPVELATSLWDELAADPVWKRPRP